MYTCSRWLVGCVGTPSLVSRTGPYVAEGRILLTAARTSGCVLSFDRGGDVAQSVERQTGTPLTQVRFPAAARDFSPRVELSVRIVLRVNV